RTGTQPSVDQIATGVSLRDVSGFRYSRLAGVHSESPWVSQLGIVGEYVLRECEVSGRRKEMASRRRDLQAILESDIVHNNVAFAWQTRVGDGIASCQR
ncbi:MAG TPA: hypothetical protein VEK56_11105, partial [Vicinamibacterales bacterium]|nr:hypothetical protein [Vicinamibacterales bacterium]